MAMKSSPQEPMLAIEALASGYGKKQVLNGVSLTINRGEIVALIGHNGAGKSTLLKAIFGVIPLWQGRILFDGRPVSEPIPKIWLRQGVVYVPQGNSVFADLTVYENLALGGAILRTKQLLKDGIDRALSQFPDLTGKLNRRAGALSGGEKQMLALSRALVLMPRFLLLDEPSLGLAPPLVSRALDHLQQMSREKGIAVLIVEQKVREVIKIAQRVYVLRTGRVSFSGDAKDLEDEIKLKEAFL